MTTILATRIGIFSDSATVTNDGIYTAPKIFRIKDKLVGCAGSDMMIQPFLAAMRKGRKPKIPHVPDEEREFSALIVDEAGISYADEGYNLELMEEDQFGIGTGGQAAHAAYRAGATPEEAITIACEIDQNSALPVQKLYLDPDFDPEYTAPTDRL